jgi:hypothetical protein
LRSVIDELKEILELKTENSSKVLSKKELSEDIKDALFDKLKHSLLKRKSRLSLATIDELEKYKLDSDDEIMVEQLKKLVSNRDYKGALKLF